MAGFGSEALLFSHPLLTDFTAPISNKRRFLDAHPRGLHHDVDCAELQHLTSSSLSFLRTCSVARRWQTLLRRRRHPVVPVVVQQGTTVAPVDLPSLRLASPSPAAAPGAGPDWREQSSRLLFFPTVACHRFFTCSAAAACPFPAVAAGSAASSPPAAAPCLSCFCCCRRLPPRGRRPCGVQESQDRPGGSDTAFP